MSDINLAEFITTNGESVIQTDYEGLLARMTDTGPADWEEVDGPDTGVGDDSWFINDAANLKARVNNDQGHVEITVHGTDDDEEDDAPVESLTFEMDDL